MGSKAKEGQLGGSPVRAPRAEKAPLSLGRREEA